MSVTKKSFTDDGWAVWIEGNNTSKFYLNDWLNPKGESYIDVAVQIKGIKATSSLNIYIPFQVSHDEITDVSLLLNNEGILKATFNATCIIDYQKNECTSEIAYNGKTLDLIHISKLGYELKGCDDGSLLTVDLEKLQKFLANDEGYVAFRIPHKTINEAFAPKIDVSGLFNKICNLLTSPVIAENYGCSIRINEARLLPTEVNHNGAFHRQKLKKTTITVSIDEVYEVSDTSCYRIRKLEKALYNNYMPEQMPKEDVITYQWTESLEENTKGRFNFFFSIKRSSISQTSMFIYILLALILGVISSTFCDLVKKLFSLIF